MESLSAALSCFTVLKLTPLITQSSFGGSCLRWAWSIQFIRTISVWNPFIDNLIRMLKIIQKLDKFKNFLFLSNIFGPMQPKMFEFTMRTIGLCGKPKGGQ
jgi:hypothetical protein